MHKLVIQTNRTDYLYHFKTQKNRDGTQTLTVQSQWCGAKNPHDLQTRWQCTLGPDEWSELISFMEDSLCQHPND